MLVMTFATKSFASVSVGVTRVAVQGVTIVTSLAKAIIHRREIMRLAELDERGLKDIGLVRSDVDGALATSWLDDPSTILASRARTSSGVASARRTEAARQADVRSQSVKAIALAEQKVACSA